MSFGRPSRDDIAGQLQQHIERVRAAGIDWVPAPDRTRRFPAFDESDSAGPSESLFAAVEPVAPVPALADRRIALAVLAEEVRGCTACGELASTRTQTVFGVGPMDVEVCFIGEAPGADEDRQGEPFVGAAGQLLNRIISACGFRREEVYICNILKCRPPGNRAPKPDEAANCRPFLDRQLELIHPRFVCCLGATATQYLLQTRAPIGKMRGRFYSYNDIPVICTYHPASLLPSRSPENKKLVWDDMKMLLAKMGRPVPQAGK